MNVALLLLAWLWGLGAKKRAPRATPPRPDRGGERGGGGGTDIIPTAPQASTRPPTSTTVTTPPWPQVVPEGLPAFPGPGWEYDEPPPIAVKQRAGQLVSALWKGGAGTFRTEQTASRWITYQAAIVASGKRGVVAFRQKKTVRALPAAPQVQTASTTTLALGELRRGMGMKPAAPHEQVKIAQRKINERLRAPVLPLEPDGRFGKLTETAVQQYQAQEGLPKTGVIDAATWRALYVLRA